MFCVKTMDFKNICLLIALVHGCMATCRFPGAPAHSEIIFSNDQLVEGTVATYSCERGFELLGPARRVCENGIWLPDGIPFCVLNVAAGKAPMQISTEDGGIPQRALDGSTSAVFSPDTCTLTKPERVPWWYVNLLEPYMVQLVRLDFGKSCCGDKIQAEVVVRVGNSRPDLGTNPTCNHFTGSIEEGQPLFLPCNPPMPGAFVSVHLESSTPIQLSICEAFVYTDQALPIERCPQFRDQPPGSTATYNGKCYIFYDRQPATFMDSLNFCRSRGGTLVDESNPALQGFISWELWRRHRSDVSSHYWMGAVRDKNDKVNWKWLNGDDVTVSFWNAPGGNADCARFDGGKGWLWADTDCNARLNFICQHQPKACGKPEQPPGSQMTTDHFQVGASVQYSCDDGHLLLGPAVRTCQETGFYDEYPPFCKRIDCGFPGDLKHGKYELLNGSVSYLSHVQYSCDEGYEMVGRSRLVCDIDERWNGPPPKCAVVQCENPPQVLNGRVVNPKNISLFGTTVEYSCHRGYKLVGVKRIECLANGTWDKPAPQCQLEERTTARTTTTTTITTVSSSPTSTVIIPSSTPRITATRRPYSSPTPFTLSPVKKVRPKTTTERAKVADKLPDIEDIHLSPTSHLPHIIVAPTPIDNNQKGHKHLVSTETTPVAKSTDDKAQIIRAKHELSFGAMLALGIIGCLLFLIAVIVSTVVLFKNCSKKKNKRQRYRHHVGPDCTNTVASVESSSSRSTSGLNKYYVQAWEELHEAAAVKKNRRLDREAPKDESELVVSDMYPGHLGRDKRKHHHHHHHREPQSDWAAANRSRHNHRSRRNFPM